MKPIARLLAAGTALAIFTGLTGTAVAQSDVTYYHCHVANYYRKAGKTVFYHSALFPAAKGMDFAASEAMTDRFLRYVEANYPAADQMLEKKCIWIDDKAHAEKIYRYQTTKSIYEHVVTEWRQGGR